MSARRQEGFWRDRARGVGYLLLLGAALLFGATVLAWLAVVLAP